VVLVRQRPGKGNAVFMTLEDETGIANALIWARDFERMRRAVMSARLAVIEGRVQRSPEGVVHLMTTMVHDRTAELQRLVDGRAAGIATAHGAPLVPSSHADEASHPSYPRPSPHRHPRTARIMPKSRDFH
jgi:error-prone DNA polymerase